MAIIKSKEIDLGTEAGAAYDGVKANRVSSDNEYYYCTNNNGKVIKKSEEPVTGNTDFILGIFGADTLEELDAEILKLGLK